MEFPDLGAHCSEPSCQRLDFLPLKCDACSGIFCADHVAYAQHHCGSAYQKDIQVPVCPLCNVPVPVARGEPPDRAVGEHIDRDCRSDPAQQKRKIFTNKCERSGCRQREMMKLTCERCGGNFCIKHRHPLDHDCSGASHPTSRPGLAAISRAQGLGSSTSTVPSPSRTLPSSTSPSRATTQSPSRSAPPVIALQNGLSEDEALQRALELSLAETKPQVPRCYCHPTCAIPPSQFSGGRRLSFSTSTVSQRGRIPTAAGYTGRGGWEQPGVKTRRPSPGSIRRSTLWSQAYRRPWKRAARTVWWVGPRRMLARPRTAPCIMSSPLH
ncbi:AN1-type zinc finger protein 2B isoform X1 [Halichoerus grypus]|uniref:AN1-type zinc finger protein 2B isoform X1 n=2 Tax=Halichoerus grypus TaxID=9711 RepID=UPI00165934DA|nr:AN1-type zinc finger protein 2B isoform X1 [Halichoerus grypus]XP_035938910.1 AN1-type zinc finger protein 2B isoform X1 [Halichoerus grypus]XP_035938911.1 AN1-type zinc finger protein 2B isoform X1 [Halichoerus grypus]